MAVPKAIAAGSVQRARKGAPVQKLGRLGLLVDQLDQGRRDLPCQLLRLDVPGIGGDVGEAQLASDLSHREAVKLGPGREDLVHRRFDRSHAVLLYSITLPRPRCRPVSSCAPIVKSEMRLP